MDFSIRMLVVIVMGLIVLVALILIVDSLSGGSIGLANSVFGKIGEYLNIDFGGVG